MRTDYPPAAARATDARASCARAPVGSLSARRRRGGRPVGGCASAGSATRPGAPSRPGRRGGGASRRGPPRSARRWGGRARRRRRWCPGPAVEPLEDTDALLRRDSRPVVLHGQDHLPRRLPVHDDRDGPGARAVRDGVLDQVRDRLAEQHLAPVDPGGARPVVAEVHPPREGVGDVRGARLAREDVEVEEARLAALAGLAPGEGEELVREPRRRLGVLVEGHDRLVDGARVLLAQDELGLGLDDRERRAELVRRVGDEPPLPGDRAPEPLHQVVDGGDERRDLRGRPLELDGREVVGGPARDRIARLVERAQAARHAEPDDPRGEDDEGRLGHGLPEHQLSGAGAAAVHGLRHLHEHRGGRVGGVAGGQGGDAHRIAAIHGVVIDRPALLPRGSRQVGVAGQERLLAGRGPVGDPVEEPLLARGVEHLQREGRDVDGRHRADEGHALGDGEGRRVEGPIVRSVDGGPDGQEGVDRVDGPEGAEGEQEPAEEPRAERAALHALSVEFSRR